MFDFIKKRDAQTQARKRMKKDLDEIFEFNNEEKQQHTLNHIVQLANNDLKEIGWVRLLDEGTVLYGDGSIRSYIKRGTIKEFYDSLEDDYIGYINIGHINFATLPIFVGQWTKNDLRLVDIGENRQALEVNMKIDESLSVIQDLQKMPYTIGISAEFMASYDEELSYEYEFPVIEHIFIMGFGIVGDVGNVNSSGINLSAEEADKMALADLFGKKKENDQETIKEPETKQTESKEEPKEPEVATKKSEEQNVEENDKKESEAELSEKEDHTFEQLYNLSMEQNEKMVVELEQLRAENKSLKEEKLKQEQTNEKAVQRLEKLMNRIEVSALPKATGSTKNKWGE
ncbi:hypothetical protein FEW48_002537 [Enterococcus faecalis]|uniref:hypothetical protein n=1 Tax=Enterococcus faecalis TaxID=1351 RepID=UPI00044C403E|nr:hypothetical protein [Enterococcus faecalis]EGO7881637.1 hypothetical protein [Enterococcus faecalis]EGO7994680.1 hypothetical protein [Enterococcus faecalis]EHR4182537.1 hypothetical protein [Enterococcus faecalis]ETT99977.1 hypothetical protein P003_01687 [Enterococcus faecalis EnGen0403]ETU04617.1 hypothetical protein P004_00916 [Enterococcus faecalis EnGen0404]